MDEREQQMDYQFYTLVLSLQAAAWGQMGKVASPISGKVEKNLEQAKGSIDMLEMIQRKTEGNLVEDEKKLIEHVLYELRLNYVDELKRAETEPTEEKAEEPEGSEPKATAPPETPQDSTEPADDKTGD